MDGTGLYMVENSRSLLEKEFSIQYIDSVEFLNEKILKKVMRRCERKLRRSKYATLNHWTLALYEADLVAKHRIEFEIRKVHPLVGNGVFTKKSIQKGGFVGEYAGVVRRRRLLSERDNDYVFGYVIGPQDTPYVIDAKEKGNFTRFINHSFAPNLISKWIIKDNRAHIIFIAKRNIAKGEQLTYDYGPYYWRKRPYPQPL